MYWLIVVDFQRHVHNTDARTVHFGSELWTPLDMAAPQGPDARSKMMVEGMMKKVFRHIRHVYTLQTDCYRMVSIPSG